MREIHFHKSYLNGDRSDDIGVFAEDEIGPGGACHEYRVRCPSSAGIGYHDCVVSVRFQKGPILEHGLNGATHEALLAIIIDRLKSFQEGPFRCRENAIALTHFEEGLNWLHKRTANRISREVEGSSEV
jgi:hypothetical protein